MQARDNRVRRPGWREHAPKDWAARIVAQPGVGENRRARQLLGWLRRSDSQDLDLSIAKLSRYVANADFRKVHALGEQGIHDFTAAFVRDADDVGVPSVVQPAAEEIIGNT